MKYVHINTGTLVESSSELPASVFKKVEDTPARAKTATKAKTARTTTKKEG